MPPIKQREFENKKLKITLLTVNPHLILNIFFLCIIILLVYKFRDEIFNAPSIDSQEVNIVMFGDSIIEDGDWSALLDRNDVKKRGFRGFTTSHYRWILEDSVLIYSPKICFISGGINDIGSGIPLKRTKSNYKSLIDTFKSNNITLIIQSTLYQENNLKSKIQVDSLNNYLKKICSKHNVTFLDINSKLSTNKGLNPQYSKDGTHLNKSAYIIWAEELKNLLRTIE